MHYAKKSLAVIDNACNFCMILYVAKDFLKDFQWFIKNVIPKFRLLRWHFLSFFHELCKTWRGFITRFEVLDYFSAAHLWFRNYQSWPAVSVLTQRCTLPENLQTALIQLWSVLINQLLEKLNIALWKSLNITENAWEPLNIYDNRWSSLSDSEWIFLV